MPFLVLHAALAFLLDLARVLARSDRAQNLEPAQQRQRSRLNEHQARQPRPSRREQVALAGLAATLPDLSRVAPVFAPVTPLRWRRELGTRRRTLLLPTALARSLTAHRARQEADRLRAGAGWSDCGLVFTTRTGRPLEPRNIVRAFKALLIRAGLPDTRFHDLRHSAMTFMAVEKVPVEVAQRILGHSAPLLTARVYRHVLDEEKRLAAEAIGRSMERLAAPTSVKTSVKAWKATPLATMPGAFSAVLVR